MPVVAISGGRTSLEWMGGTWPSILAQVPGLTPLHPKLSGVDDRVASWPVYSRWLVYGSGCCTMGWSWARTGQVRDWKVEGWQIRTSTPRPLQILAATPTEVIEQTLQDATRKTMKNSKLPHQSPLNFLWVLCSSLASRKPLLQSPFDPCSPEKTPNRLHLVYKTKSERLHTKIYV